MGKGKREKREEECGGLKGERKRERDRKEREIHVLYIHVHVYT